MVQSRQDGVALVVVLLFTVVILMIIVSTTATISLGARGGGVNERAAYQALLAAESALNTFPVRAAAKMKTQAVPKRTGNPQSDRAALNAWLGGMNSYASGGRQATLTFENLQVTASGATFQVASTASEGSARKVALQDFVMTVGGSGTSRWRAPRAALTSLPPISGGGSASISGQGNGGVITQVQGTATQLSAADRTFSLPVQDATGLRVGDYMTVGGTTVRVDAISGDELAVKQVLPTRNAVAANTLKGGVSLMMNAVAETYSGFTDPMAIKASNASDFIVGEKVTVAGQAGTVTAVDGATGTITIDWTGTAPTSLPEGTQILRDVRAMRSAEGIEPKSNKLDDYAMDQVADCTASGHGNNGSIDCAGAYDPVLQGNPLNPRDPFFTQMIMGMTDDELNSAVPVTPSGNWTDMQNDIRRIDASDFKDLIMNTNYSGILIVDGDIGKNGDMIRGNTSFTGLIYFRGNAGGKFNGNLHINGAIAVRGGPIEGLTTDDTSTTLLTGNLTVNYNAAALRKQLGAIQGSGAPVLVPVPGTWRQR